jgi:glyoxylase-like metal-dependent hydrolase (beta-lactamase superfamily II)
VLVAGDYLSPVEIPTIGPTTIAPSVGQAPTIGSAVGEGPAIDAYLTTLERLRPLVARASQVVPGHGPIMEGARAHAVLEEDRAYLQQLRERGAEAVLPAGRRNAEQRRLHGANVAHIRG